MVLFKVLQQCFTSDCADFSHFTLSCSKLALIVEIVADSSAANPSYFCMIGAFA